MGMLVVGVVYEFGMLFVIMVLFIGELVNDLILNVVVYDDIVLFC